MEFQWAREFPGAYYIDRQEERAVLEVLRKGSLFRHYGLGKPRFADAYEAAAREFYGVPFALGVNSGTGALCAAMQAMDIGPGCEVIVPSFAWVAAMGAVVLQNAIPVVCEVDDSFTLDPSDLEKKITPRTRLIVAVHMTGGPCDMKRIMAIAGKHHVRVLEDAAQCNGGSFGGRMVGGIGTMGIFSLQINKNITSGEGGLILTHDEGLYYRAYCAHDMGAVRSKGRLSQAGAHPNSWGMGRRLSELCAAVAGVQLKKLPRIVSHMRRSKRRIKEGLEGTRGLTLRRLNDAEGDTGSFLTLILSDEPRAARAIAIMKEKGLFNAARLSDYGQHLYYNMPSLVRKVPLSPAGNPWSLEENRQSRYDYHKGACPRSDALFARSIVLPIPSKLTRAQEKGAVQIIREAVEG